MHAASRISDWADHIRRNRVQAWPGFLYKYMNGLWFQARRITMGSSSVFGGRTATRSGAGGPKTRYHEGVGSAEIYLANV